MEVKHFHGVLCVSNTFGKRERPGAHWLQALPGGDPPGIRTPDPLLKRQSPDSQGWGEPKTCCCSSTFRSSVFCVYVTRPTAYPVFYYNQKNGIRQTFLSINRYLILEINHSKAIFNRDDKMFRKTLLPDTNIFLTTAEALP